MNTGLSFEWPACNERPGQTLDLSTVADVDVFGKLLDAMDAIGGVKVTAYMNSMGPPLLKHGESFAFDYTGSKDDGSQFEDSSEAAACGLLMGGDVANGSPCSPSIRKWVQCMGRHQLLPSHINTL
jgi:hypothetical protein